MHRKHLPLSILLLAIFACQTLIPTPSPTSTFAPTSTATPAPTHTPLPPTASPSPTLPSLTPTDFPTGTATPTFLPSPSVTPTSPPSFTVRFHPEGRLFVSDIVSMEVIPPADTDAGDNKVKIQLNAPDGPVLGSSDFGSFGIAGRQQATLYWIWDTAELDPDSYPLTFSIQPEGITWTQTITLYPEVEIPAPQPEAFWETVKTECCRIHYITDTAGERDISTLIDQADRLADSVVDRMGVEFSDPVVVTLLPRVLGHGGYAFGEIAVSYLDRNYAGSSMDMVLHHEMAHILDEHLGGDLRPTILLEGLAVYLSGGHFKPEPLIPRAAALLEQIEQGDLGLGWYLPLAPLADDFYFSQHEIGYLQAGALVQYMVDTWGWFAFSNFYREIHPHSSGNHSSAIEIALGEHFDLTLAQLEERFIQTLRQVQVTAVLYDDVRLTVAFYDTVRRYQNILDPSAYFLTAWLPYPVQMRKDDIVADYLRHPSSPENLALETMLVAADDHLRSERYSQAQMAIDAVNAVLDSITQDSPEPFNAHSLAKAHFSIVTTSLAHGYLPQRIQITDDTAQVLVSTGRADISDLGFVSNNDEWEMILADQ